MNDQSESVNKHSFEAESKKDQKLKTCSCRRSKCLKLYCDCLANNEYCGPDCLCIQCRNQEIYKDERNNAIFIIVKKNPKAFDSKLILK